MIEFEDLKMRQVGKRFFTSCVLVTLALLSIVSHSSQAGLVRVESESYLSGRAGYFDSKLELPVREFMAGSFETDDKRLSVNTSFSLFADPIRLKTDSTQKDANLYTGELNYRLIPDFLKVRVGRSFDMHYSIGANAVDAVAGEISLFENMFNVGGFYGLERKPEIHSDGNYGDIGGFHVRLTQASMYPWSLTGKVQQRFLLKTPPTESERLAQFAVSKPLDWVLSPTLLADATMNIDSKHLDRLDVEADLYPSLFSSVRMKAMSFELLHEEGSTEPPVYSMFARGRLYEGLLQLETQVTSRLIFGLATAYDDYQSTLSTRQHGYRVEFETRYTRAPYGLSNVAYLFKSYGGDAYGDRIRLSRKFNLQNEIYGESDVTYYEKITASKRFATHFEAGYSRWFANQLKLDSFGEFNSNNFLKYDFRMVFKLTYFLWAET